MLKAIILMLIGFYIAGFYPQEAAEFTLNINEFGRSIYDYGIDIFETQQDLQQFGSESR